MADFIAVIRRAVDGLSENTPEMRARVYVKARAAVERQLENMKPRPPEEMLRRQLEKLDAAISQVEEEHAEALPALADVAEDVGDAVHAPPTPEPQPTPEQIAWAEPERAPEPYLEPAKADPAPQGSSWDRPFDDGAPSMGSETAQASVPAQPVPDYVDPLASFIETLPIVPLPAPVVVSAPIIEAPIAKVEDAPKIWPVEVDSEPETWVEPVDDTPGQPTEMVDPVLAALGQAPEVRMPRARFDENEALADFGDLAGFETVAPAPVEPVVARTPEPVIAVAPPAPDIVPSVTIQPEMPSATTSDFSWDAPFDDLPDLKPAAPVMPAAAIPEIIAAPVVPTPAATFTPPAPEPIRKDRDPLAELDELIGFTKNRNASGAQPNSLNADARAGSLADVDTGPVNAKSRDVPADVSRAISKLEGKSFRTEPRKANRTLAVIALSAVILAIIGGSATALWLNYDKIVSVVAGTDAPKKVATKTDTKTKVKPADNANNDQKPAVPNENAEAAKPVANDTEVAALTPNEASPEKFTQRLLTDGTETASDASPIKINAELPEGKTVAGQTVASQNDGTADTGVDVADAGKTTGTATDAKTDGTAVTNNGIGIAQKMFLYEERLGQGTPAAIEGTVTWSIKNEASDGGKPEPVIEGRIDVPGPDKTSLMTILMTFKRNSDSSLPASHIIEMVFQLPKDFEGGNIESVDRISMKPTEQNIGNPLIAVPAKITDDFHMIALNDDKDAITRNLELIRTRPWIDVPVTYRNGRKALLTLEKGTSGTAAFDKVLAEWAALGPAASN